MQIHLDMLGGIAGDMFIAALLHAFPQHERRVLRIVIRGRSGLVVGTPQRVDHGCFHSIAACAVTSGTSTSRS